MWQCADDDPRRKVHTFWPLTTSADEDLSCFSSTLRMTIYVRLRLQEGYSYRKQTTHRHSCHKIFSQGVVDPAKHFRLI